MNNKEESAFIKEWGEEVASGGFLQVPHDFLRNLGTLDVSGNEAVLLMLIMGYDKGSQITARKLAQDMGVDVKTVRNAFRKLHKQQHYLHRHYDDNGGANRFTYGGMKKMVRELAKSRQASTRKLHTGMGGISRKHKQVLHTNKEDNIKRYKEQRDGYIKFVEMGNNLKKRNKN